jgi:hypothetical protein
MRGDQGEMRGVEIGRKREAGKNAKTKEEQNARQKGETRQSRGEEGQV